MKKIKLTEATAKTPLEKMHDVDHGRRNQNWGACSDTMLKMYYKTCIDHSLQHALVQCEQEIIKRGQHNWLLPRLTAVTDYSTSFAQHLWDEHTTCHRIIQEAIDIPYTGHPLDRPSEYLVKAYVLIKCMGHESDFKMLEIWIKNHMKDQDTYYNQIPSLLQIISDNPTVVQRITTAVAGVNFS